MTGTYHLWAMIFIGILALFICAFAYQKRFFTLPAQIVRENEVRFDQLVVIVTLYFFTILFLSSYIYKAMNAFDPNLSQTSEVTWLNFLIFSTVLLLFMLYFCLMNKQTLRNIFKRNFPEKKSIFYDIGIGIVTLFIAYPLSQFLSLLTEVILFYLFKVKQLPDQIAVEFLKNTLDYPLNFLLATISIVLFAPLIEEIVFRGFLQNFLKKYLGRGSAIYLSSFVFAAVHFRIDQQLANIHILIILFILGILLGFVYEKQKSLFAAISLHASFNAINVINLLIFKDQSLL
jgi:membrane protease YdiL (CAAX protease family)